MAGEHDNCDAGRRARATQALIVSGRPTGEMLSDTGRRAHLIYGRANYSVPAERQMRAGVCRATGGRTIAFLVHLITAGSAESGSECCFQVVGSRRRRQVTRKNARAAADKRLPPPLASERRRRRRLQRWP